VKPPHTNMVFVGVAADVAAPFATHLAADGVIRIVQTAQPGGDLQDGLLTAITLPSDCTLHLVFDRSLRPIVTLAIGLDVVGRVGSGRIAIGCAYTAPLAASLPLADPLSRRRTGAPSRTAGAGSRQACPHHSPITRPARATDGA
jgi:hypothetical protein